jgi:hypothetical protein
MSVYRLWHSVNWRLEHRVEQCAWQLTERTPHAGLSLRVAMLSAKAVLCKNLFLARDIAKFQRVALKGKQWHIGVRHQRLLQAVHFHPRMSLAGRPQK